MKKISNKVFFRIMVHILLTALLVVFYGGTSEKTVEAQQKYPAPAIVSVSPNEAEIGESIELSILGKYFLEGAKLSFSPPTGISVSWVKVLSPEKISAGIAIAKDAPVGPRDITVINSDGQSYTAKGAFYLKAAVLPSPVITSVSPSEAETDKTVELSVFGKNFLEGAKIVFYPPTGISLLWAKLLSDEEIGAGIAIAKDAPVGPRDVTVTNPDGQSYTAKGAFYLKAVVLPPPVIISVSPNEAEIGESIELSILGKYFLEGAKLSFSPSTGISLLWVKFVSSGELRVGIAIAKDAPIGIRDVTITNTNQQGYTAKASFYVKTITPPLPLPTTLPAPAITGVSPTEADAGETVEFTISGKGFTAEAQISFSPPTGINMVSLKSISSGEMRAVISIAGDAPPGARDVTLTNSDGQSYTAKAGFHLNEVIVPSPVTTGISPDEAEVEKATELPAPVIANIPVENKTQQLRKSFHRLITGVANKVINWVEGLKIKMADKAIENIRGSAFSEMKPSLEGRTLCTEPPDINYQTLHVSPPKGTGKTGTGSTSDGSVARPFPTIAQALARAEEFHYEGVEIIVGRGTYVGDLIITRPTKIIGESRTSAIIVGSIINNSIYSLTLDSLLITGPKSVAGEVGKEGALVISNVCASTNLRRINIESHQNYGIFQNGGKLSVSDVQISDTAASESIASSGTAIHLSNVDTTIAGIVIERSGRFAIRQIGGSLIVYGSLILDTKTREELSEAGTSIWTSDGAKTDISGSIINGSRSSALIIQGRQTEAFLRDVVISDTRVNPYLMQEHIIVPPFDRPLPPIRWRPSAFAAIQVQQEAQLIMDRSRVTNNEYMGLRVVDNAQARITNTCFSHTRGYAGSESGSWTFGTNIQAKNNGYIYLENVTSQHADLCGLQLYGGTADYHIGEVSYNTIGVHITTAGFDIRRLQDRVAYFANGLDLDMEYLPVPEPSVPAAD